MNETSVMKANKLKASKGLLKLSGVLFFLDSKL